MGALSEHAAVHVRASTLDRRIVAVQAILDDLDEEDRELLEGWLAMPIPTRGQQTSPDRMGHSTIVEALQAIGYQTSYKTIKAYREWLDRG